MAGPSPDSPPNRWSLAMATAVGPTAPPMATFRKKLMDMARPRERLGTTSRIAEKPHAVTMPDSAKYAGIESITRVTLAALRDAATGSISPPATRQTSSFRDQPPVAPALSASQPPIRTPPPNAAVRRMPNWTPTWARSNWNSRVRSVGAQAPTALSTREAIATTAYIGMTLDQPAAAMAGC